MKSIIFTIALFFLCLSAFSAVVSPKDKAPHYVSHDIQIMVNGKSRTLRAGTPVVVEAIQTYSSKNLSIGQSVSVRVRFNVVVDKETLVSAGSLGSATVSDIRKKGIFGRPGKLELQIQSVQAVDGQQVMLSGIPLTLEGKSNATLAWIVSGILFFTTIIGGAFGFLVKGKEASFRAGTQLNANVASDMEVDP